MTPCPCPNTVADAVHRPEPTSGAMSDAGAQVRVLLVDDHEDMLNMMRLMMRRRNYEVETAQSGSQAITKLAHFTPHVIVSDIGMPEMNGCEMMISIKARPDQAPFRSIALTGYDDPLQQDEVMNAGYDAHLTKPVDFDVLFRMVEKFAGSVQPL
jgi:CheY-like chemotaxis protein